MKRLATILMTLTLLVTCAAARAETTDLVVFAAASMTETLTQIKAAYEAEHPDVNITYNFDSSGTLKTQIQEGAECDLFISAGQKQMNQLEAHLGLHLLERTNHGVVLTPAGFRGGGKPN